MEEWGLQRAEKLLLPLGPTIQSLIHRASKEESGEVWCENSGKNSKEIAIKLLEKRE